MGNMGIEDWKVGLLDLLVLLGLLGVLRVLGVPWCALVCVMC